MSKYSKLTGIQLSVEILGCMVDMCTPEELHEVISAIYSNFHDGINPTFSNSRLERMYNRSMAYTNDKADAFLRQHRNFINQDENPSKKKDATGDAENVEMDTSTTQEEKVAQKPNICLTEGVSDNTRARMNREELDYNTKCQVWEDMKPLIYDSQGLVFPVDEIEDNFAANKYALQCKYEVSEDYMNMLFDRAIESIKPKEL